MIPQLGLLLATAAAFAPTRINKYSLSTRLGATPLGANLPLVITTIDARPVEGEPGVYDFDKNIVGDAADDDAHFFKDVTKREEKGVNIYRGTEVQNAGAAIDEIARKRGAKHCMMYVHGFTNTPSVVFDAVEAMNEYYKGKDMFVVPICWPAERVNYFGQKEDAPGAANALRSLVPGVMSATTPISVMCHSMGNFVLKKFAPDDPAKVRFKFHNIYMVAADVRSTTFDKGDDTGDGADILSICGKKVHVLWNWWDMALLGRRALNSGRRALGKVGDEGKQGDGKLIADASELVYRESNDLNKQVKGFVNRRTGHGYQAVDGALDYYLAEL